jgi:hypothetical protein
MIYDKASLAQIPSGVGVNTLFSVVPNTSTGDFAYTGATNGTRVNKDGLIETIPANVPRLNYNFINGVVQPDPHLLLEPTRTNRITDTEGWSNFADPEATKTDVTNVIAPDGGISGIKKLTATSTNQPRIEWAQISIPSTTTTYVWSVFVKKDTARYVGLSHFSDTTQNVIFDLDTGSIEDETGTDVPAKIEYYGNGWYRISKGATILNTATFNIFKFHLCTKDAINTGVNGESALIWGFQIEIGNYVSSFIPTTTVGAITTRAVDNAQIASGAEDIIGSQNEGTLFIDLEIPYDTTSSDYFQFSISDPDAEEILDNRVFINFISGEAQFQVFSGGSGVGFCNTPTPKNIRLKIAGSYETDNFVLFKDGLLADDIDTGGTVNFTTQMESIRYADQGNGLKFQAKVYQTMFFKEALTQDELETLTSYKSFNEMATQQLYIIE